MLLLVFAVVGLLVGLLVGREERRELRQDLEARDTVLRFVLQVNEKLARASAVPSALEQARRN